MAKRLKRTISLSLKPLTCKRIDGMRNKLPRSAFIEIVFAALSEIDKKELETLLQIGMMKYEKEEFKHLMKGKINQMHGRIL